MPSDLGINIQVLFLLKASSLTCMALYSRGLAGAYLSVVGCMLNFYSTREV